MSRKLFYTLSIMGIMLGIGAYRPDHAQAAENLENALKTVKDRTGTLVESSHLKQTDNFSAETIDQQPESSFRDEQDQIEEKKALETLTEFLQPIIKSMLEQMDDEELLNLDLDSDQTDSLIAIDTVFKFLKGQLSREQLSILFILDENGELQNPDNAQISIQISKAFGETIIRIYFTHQLESLPSVRTFKITQHTYLPDTDGIVPTQQSIFVEYIDNYGSGYQVNAGKNPEYGVSTSYASIDPGTRLGEIQNFADNQAELEELTGINVPELLEFASSLTAD